MADEQSEEKTLPASEKKLRDGRKKGQVSKSKDVISGFVLLAVVVYLLSVWPSINDQLAALIQMVSLAAGPGDTPFINVAEQAITIAVTILFQVTAQLVAIIVFVTFIAGMAGTLGPVFAFDSIKPNFDHINPAKGMEKIFSMRNVAEFAKNVLKVIILAAAFGILLLGWLLPLFEISACGNACIAPFLVTILKQMASVAAAAFVIIGVVDVGVQYRLFLRDMKMTRTEFKRELKDLEGDPLVRSHHRQLRQQAALEIGIGIESAVFAVAAADGSLVGLRYGPDAPLPIIIAKAQGVEGTIMRTRAQELGIPVVDDDPLAVGLIEQHKLRAPILQEFFDPVIVYLAQLNIL